MVAPDSSDILVVAPDSSDILVVAPDSSEGGVPCVYNRSADSVVFRCVGGAVGVVFVVVLTILASSF